MRRIFLTLAGLTFAGSLLATAQDMDQSFLELKDAVEKKDVAQVKKLAGETSALARKAAAEPVPADAAEKADWTKRVKHAKEVDSYSEYALYSTAVASQPETLIDLFETLEKQNPKSQYLEGGYNPYFAVIAQQPGGTEKVTALAEKALANLPNDEDLLLVMTKSAYAKGNRPQAAVYAQRLVNALAKHPKPESLSAADWDKKKGECLGQGYWTLGIAQFEKQQYYQADQSLRAALPYLKGNDALLGPALYELGVANYNLGKQFLKPAQIREGAKFSEQAAKIPGSHAQQAWTNAHLMNAEADKMMGRK